MRWGFVLDQDSCIGCHACTVACKQENEVPLGAFRTWVKWIEHGQFPETSRSAAVLRCNHCEDAPCVKICPTIALHKRDDGIVDLDHSRCIGCASCLQACPYDAIYIDPDEGTAAKCHFCAHRMEVNLAPACVAVCPEQAIKVVDLDDPATRAELGEAKAVVRKPERGTKPQTYYLGVDPLALDPLAVDGTRTMSHAEVPDPMPAPGNAAARAVYDVPRVRPWGNRIAAYMVTKAIASGALIAAVLQFWGPDVGFDRSFALLALVMNVATMFLLVSDLHKPARFLYLLTKGNSKSWLVRGGYVLAAHAGVSLLWALRPFDPPTDSIPMGAFVFSVFSILVALATSAYTAFLFWQARGRELWAEDRTLMLVLIVQAFAAGSAVGWFAGDRSRTWALGYLAVTIFAHFLKPATAAARQAHRYMIHHPAYWGGVLLAATAVFYPPLVIGAFAFLDWIYVKAGQEVALS